MLYVQKHLGSYEPKFSGRDELKQGRSWLRKKKKAGLYDRYVADANKLGEWSEGTINTSSIALCNHHISLALFGRPKFLMAAYKFAYPNTAGAPFVLRVPTEVAGKLAVFRKPLKETKSFKLRMKPK